jgi:hypothetical protein
MIPGILVANVLLALGVYYFFRFCDRIINHFNANFNYYVLIVYAALFFFLIALCVWLSVVLSSWLSLRNNIKIAVFSIASGVAMLGGIVIYYTVNSNSWFEGEVLVVEDSYIYCPFLYATYRFLMDFPVFFGLAFFFGGVSGFYVVSSKFGRCN